MRQDAVFGKTWNERKPTFIDFLNWIQPKHDITSIYLQSGNIFFEKVFFRVSFVSLLTKQ